MMTIFSWLKEKFASLPSIDEITPEREEEIIDKVVMLVSRLDMEVPAELFGGSFEASAPFIAQTVIWPLCPLLSLMGINSYEYTAFLNNRENLIRLLDKIRESRRRKEDGL